ncbi:hypothetical protein C1645_738894 [Glomus cerebriforme]|uniref:FAR1 domain-containing protein n=1 Tax=Glomus cerebriforme TaxID=658196 RepID=A0A397T205_9GLOM|nr:hypothetical protein C1645_738894 [Glomus cerebriforme]
MFNDDSDTETFTNEFLNNIPDDSEEEYPFEAIENSNNDLSTLTLILEVGMTFLTWKSAYDHINSNKVFFIRQGRCVKLENERRKQTILCNCEGTYNNEAKKNKSKPSKTYRTNCKWKVYNQDLYKEGHQEPQRFKGPLENSSHSNEVAGERNQNKCGLCNNVGHNRATCPSNPNRKKRRQEQFEPGSLWSPECTK